MGSGVHQKKIPVLQGTRQFEPRAMGHVDVHEDHIRGQVFDQPFRLARTGSGLHDPNGRTRPFNLSAQQVPAMGLVVDDQGVKLSKHFKSLDPRKNESFKTPSRCLQALVDGL
jgi:hypothetical protein